MKCRVCRTKAVIQVKRHNANFCRDHFLTHVRRQVERTIHDYRMFGAGDRLLLGVSGGKDSLVLWDILTDLGYGVDGVYLDLGIEGYSSSSLELTKSFAADRNLRLEIIDLRAEYGFGIPEAADAARRVPCSVCGLSKRYILNQAAEGYDVLMTGHNLDDEVATLFGNVMQWQTEYLARQQPVLEKTESGLVRKVKPLIRVAERETAAYAVLTGIEYEVDECPMAGGNTINRYKEWINRLEADSPGIKAQFLFGFLERAQGLFEAHEDPVIVACSDCGRPTTGGSCAFCRLRGRTKNRVDV